MEKKNFPKSLALPRGVEDELLKGRDLQLALAGKQSQKARADHLALCAPGTENICPVPQVASAPRGANKFVKCAGT